MNTRREFLMLMAAAAGMPALRQLERLERRGPEQRVIVLGAGLAGLCSAYELQNQGHTVSVLEAQMRPGGRVRTLRTPFAPGLYTEAGAESIPGAHQLTQHYARTLGLKLMPNSVPGVRAFHHVRGKRVMNNDAAVWPSRVFATRSQRNQLVISSATSNQDVSTLKSGTGTNHALIPRTTTTTASR